MQPSFPNVLRNKYPLTYPLFSKIIKKSVIRLQRKRAFDFNHFKLLLLLPLTSSRCDDAFFGCSIGEIFNISIACDRWVTIGGTILRFFLFDNRINSFG